MPRARFDNQDDDPYADPTIDETPFGVSNPETPQVGPGGDNPQQYVGDDTTIPGGTPNGTSNTTPSGPGGFSAGTSSHARVDAALQAAQSTDDPNYWYGKIDSDPNGYGSAWDYWAGRIAQGDGAAGVRNGTVAKHDDGPGPTTLFNPDQPHGDYPGYGPTPMPTPTSSYTPSGSTNTSLTPGNSAYGDAIRQQILSLLNQPQVDASSPDIAPAIDAYRVQEERSLADEKDAIAERMNAQGLGSSGATDTAMRQAMETAGAHKASFAGNLVAQSAQARRSQITQILQTGAGLLTAEQQQALQRELAYLDATLRQESISNQNTQFNDQLGAQVGEFQSNMNRNAVLDAMGVHL